MKKYNRDKRVSYNARNKKINTRETYDGHNKYKRIHIPIRYANYNRIEYIPIIYGKTRNNKAQQYVNIHNIIRDIFPSIDKPHTQHIYRATAEYHKYIPQETDYTAPEHMMDKYTRTTYRNERVKCIIYNDKQEIIHYGIFIRTIEINDKDITYKLHRSDRCIKVKPFIPFTQTINGVDIHEIWKHNVEIYKI